MVLHNGQLLESNESLRKSSMVLFIAWAVLDLDSCGNVHLGAPWKEARFPKLLRVIKLNDQISIAK